MTLRRHSLPLTHDSFLDVVSNVVGVLVLVAIAVILNAKDIKIDLGAPVVRPPPKATARVIFECSRERIFRLDDAALHTISHDFASRYVTEQARTITPMERQRLFERSDVGNALYRVRIPDVRGSSLQLELRESAVGEDSLQILEPNSAYRTELAQLSPATHWIFFIVRNDSFEMFRGARQLAIERGFSIGWDPKERTAPLIFGNDARDGITAQW